MATAISGTSGLSGQFKGDFQFIANAHTDMNPNNPPVYMGQAVERVIWEWDFDTGVANFRFDLGDLQDTDSDGIPDTNAYMLTIGVPFIVHSPVNFTDNGNGTYTGLVDFQVYNAIFGNPSGLLSITWEISRAGNEITFETHDGDANGFPGTILGDAVSSPPWGGFPFPFEPTWDGIARLVGVDSNADGLLDEQALILGMDPDINDNDADGIDDVTELGADFNNPPDSDNDGIIDALEPGNDATDASTVTGLRFKGRDKSRDEVTLMLDLSVDNETLAHQIDSGKTQQGPPGIRFAFDEAGGVENGSVFHFISSATTGQATVHLHFSSVSAETVRLPDKILLYRVNTDLNTPGLENTGDNFHLQSATQWTKIDSSTLDIHLKDGGPMDADGSINGSVTANFALAENLKGDFHINSGNGSLNIWLVLTLFGVVLLLQHKTEAGNKVEMYDI